MSQATGPTIRRGTVNDAALLSELGAPTFPTRLPRSNTLEDLAGYIATSFNVAQQTSELKNPATTFMIAEVDGRPAGYANSTPVNLTSHRRR